MFLSIPTLVILSIIVLFAFYAGQKWLPALLEHDHDLVIRVLTRMDTNYAKVVAAKAKFDSQRLSILGKISSAIKPETAAAPAATPAADAQPKA